MNIEILGKFYDNHSLSMINRQLATRLSEKSVNVKIIALDSYDPKFKLKKQTVKTLKALEAVELEADIQVRHTYPPIWDWPEKDNTKVVYIQPWEFSKAPFEWQYKFETFADALIVPSNFCASVFKKGGINPSKIHTVPNGYDDSIFNQEDSAEDISSLGVDKNNFNFVYVGNAQWRKGLDILLNAWHKSFKSFDKAKLIIKDNPGIYGRNNILNDIIRLQYSTGCAEITYIDEDLSDTQMAAIFKSSKVLVHPYRAEGFGMHVQEATACGCIPVVSANGPTDDFLATQDIGIRLPTTSKAININDPSVFATKPGDAMTLMSSYSFIEEPSEEHLIKSMIHLYHSHNKKELQEKVDNAILNKWDSVIESYIDIFKTINANSCIRRL